MRQVKARLLALLAAGLLLAVPSPAAAQEAAPTSLEARVVNGTAGGGAVEGLMVTLQAFRGSQEVGRWGTAAGPGGAIRFEGLDPAGDLVYLLSAAYADVRYFSLPVSLVAPPAEPLTLQVYETTEAAEAVRILGDSTVILGADRESGTLRAIQVTTYENAGDRTFIGAMSPGGRLTVQVPLPPRAFELEAPHDPGSLVPLEGGDVFSTSPLLPGTHEIIIAYRILYLGQSYEWSKGYPYPVDRARLLVVQGIPVQAGSELKPQAPTEINGVPYTHFEAQGGPAGTRLAARFTGLPASAGTRSQRLMRTFRFTGVGLAAAALLGAGAYATLWRRRRTAEAAAWGPDHAQAREEALAHLARLEDEFEAGRLSREQYASQRETERQALQRLLEQQP